MPPAALTEATSELASSECIELTMSLYMCDSKGLILINLYPVYQHSHRFPRS